MVNHWWDKVKNRLAYLVVSNEILETAKNLLEMDAMPPVSIVEEVDVLDRDETALLLQSPIFKIVEDGDDPPYVSAEVKYDKRGRVRIKWII